MAGSVHGVGTEARALPAALTMTSAPAVVSMAALAAREAHGGLVLPAAAASVEAAAATAAELAADADIMTKGKPHLTVGLPFCPFVI